MARSEFRITGRVIDGRTQNGVPGLKVEAWDKDLLFDDMVGSAVTDAQGSFQIEFTKSYFSELFLDRHPDIFFKVFRGRDLIKSTKDSVLWKTKAGDIPILIEVDVSGDPAPSQSFVVRGQVSQADGSPLAGVTVRAFDRDLRSEQLLGECKTDRKGSYEIQYNSSQFLKSEKGNADLVVKTFATDGSLLVASSVLFNAPLVAEVDLTVPADVLLPRTLFEKISLTLAPLLEGLKAEELEEDQQHQDISFLSGETGFEKKILARFVLAHKLAKNQGIQPEFWFVLLGGSFYQYSESQSLSSQLATFLGSLPSLDATTVRKAITSGFNQKEISETFQKDVSGWIEAFLRLAAIHRLGDSTEPTFVKLALENSGIMDSNKQAKFARLINEHRSVTPGLLAILEQDESFKKEEIADLHTSFQLTELTQGDFSVVKMIKDEFDIRQPEKIRTLARKSETEWVNLVKDKHTAGEIKLPFEAKEFVGQIELPDAEFYGKMLNLQLQEAFPTTAFAGGLDQALKNGGARGLHRARDISRFLDGHEAFELLNTPVDEFLKTKTHPDSQALSEDEDFKRELKAVQRVFKLAPTFEATNVLLADGFHSAQKVYRLGESEFVRRYKDSPGFTAKSARLAWNRAADTHAAMLTVVANIKALESNDLPQALKTESIEASSSSTWDNLFQTGDLCECEHCSSVLSPASYFIDLLMFLKDRNSTVPDESSGGYLKVKDILFHRRPDLGYLELICANALTEFPYIDTVCEVLEDAVAAAAGKENDFELPDLQDMPSDGSTAKASVAAAFAARGINLGSQFSLSQLDASDNPYRWIVHSDEGTYLLKKKGGPNFFAEVLRNTKASAEELRAYPHYVNQKAYEELRKGKYPLALPFDLFAEEVRASFQKTNLQRWELMQTFQSNAEPKSPTLGEIAAEYFAISAKPDSDPDHDADEMQLILIADPSNAGQKVIWGESENNWLDQIGIVKTFLQKTGLEYNDLLSLIDLKFINPHGDMLIEHFDSSCDINQKSIKFLNANKLDRIHRFLRLSRKLNGWKMWELDLVIHCIGEDRLDEAFLINLFYVSRLKKKLGNSNTVEEVCALFGDLNTKTHFTRLHKKREGGLYQNLFLNRRLIAPLDTAFEIDPATDEIKLIQDPITGSSMYPRLSDHHPAILAALGISEADLELLVHLTRPSDGSPYIEDELTLKNLSFLWRMSWLSKRLGFKIEDFRILLKILRQDGAVLLTPKEAWLFLDKMDQLNASGFTPDELNWLLAADIAAKASVNEVEASRFLVVLRKELQTIRDEYEIELPIGEDQSAEDQLVEQLTSLLQKLSRPEAEIGIFLKAMRGRVLLRSRVQGLPPGFAFPLYIIAGSNHIPIEYDESNKAFIFHGLMTPTQREALLEYASSEDLTVKPICQNAIEDLFQQSITAPSNYVSMDVEIKLPGFDLPKELPSIPIRYNQTTHRLGFIGLMTDAERLALSSSNPAAIDAIEELYLAARLAVRFYRPVFEARLEVLPPIVDFKTQLSAELSAKISYDPELRSLQFTGIMGADEEKKLNDLVATDPNNEEFVAYHSALKELAMLPRTIKSPDERIWLTDAELDEDQPDYHTFAKRLANASKKALSYLSKTMASNAVVQQSSMQLGLSHALTRYILDSFAILSKGSAVSPKATILAHLTGDFARSSGPVDCSTQKLTLDGWYWASRVSAILKKWTITLNDLEKIVSLADGARLLDFNTLLLESPDAIASIDLFLRTSRLLRLRNSMPETDITFLEVLEKLKDKVYAKTAYFASDVQRLNESWRAVDVDALVASLDIIYPDDYLLAENWERLRRAFYFIDDLNSSAEIVKTFAAVSVDSTHTNTLKDLLRSKFGSDTWLTLSAEIQDALRERKRDALAAYLLAHLKPDHPEQDHPRLDNPPSGKWENTNDLYAYYLLDVEMSSCQMTSRLVQASGSVQLFVQRCLMGLEPNVVVKADGDDGDSAWHWWKWMRKYRVWEANRQVFLWPENWIEPELKKDRSSFFKDMENELLQNEVNQYTVETAFANYLEKLDGVAQLEIAGFYQEDNDEETTIHVFGRTKGAEPHIYYYRRYDYRQWTPWEKIDLDIQGDYLIPAVINKRLYLFWPVFSEVPYEEGNSTVIMPALEPGSSVNVERAKKKLRMQMAVSENRQQKWTAKRVSTDFDENKSQSDRSSEEDLGFYVGEIIKNQYIFIPIDMSNVNGHFYIRYFGSSVDSTGAPLARLSGAFEIFGCHGVPELLPELPSLLVTPGLAIQPDLSSILLEFMKFQEQANRREDDFAIMMDLLYQSVSAQLLKKTPGNFVITPPWHLSHLDKLWLDGLWALALSNIKNPSQVAIIYLYLLKLLAFANTGFTSSNTGSTSFSVGNAGYANMNLQGERFVPSVPIGTWLPFFYNDKNRTFFVMPCLQIRLQKGKPSTSESYRINTDRAGMMGMNSFKMAQAKDGEYARYYYPEIKKTALKLDVYIDGIVQALLDKIDPSNLMPIHWQILVLLLQNQFPEESLPPYTGEPYTDGQINQIKNLLKRFIMRFCHLFEGVLSLRFFQYSLFHFKNFYHPFVCHFSRKVHNPLEGIPGLMAREMQLKNSGFSFNWSYDPTSRVISPSDEEFYQTEVVDFELDGAYSLYNWELFFHAPLLIANSLSKNQRFEEARDWYHFIFNPIGVESSMPGGSMMSKYWITKPFFETTDQEYVQQRIDSILALLAGDRNAPGYSELEKQVHDWRTNPFEPHRIACDRIVAYQKTVVMKYLDNLFSWGDYLFRQDSMESINEATQLYIIAAEILGPRPKRISPQAKPQERCFNELERKFEEGSNVFGVPLVEVENLIPMMPGNGQDSAYAAPMPILYFCIPQNDKMLGYWDTVADRLYKIRNCMNIEGVVRKLGLFEPPIDPAALVKAVAGGMDISSALADLNASLPLYRFNILLQKANEVCNDVKALGSALLAALEKKDGEELSLLRQGQEIKLLKAVKAVREDQLEEANENLASANKSKELTTVRRDYYRDIEKISGSEQEHQDEMYSALIAQQISQSINIAASVAHVVPTFDIGAHGAFGSPKASVQFGGPNVGAGLQAAAGGFNVWANVSNYRANKASVHAGHERRWDEWKFQERHANKELEQNDASIAAAEQRIAIARKELENHLIQIENAKATDAFMKSKYTNQELYQWQVGQISGVYFQSYKLAYDLAKRAERCFRFELGLQDSSYINFGYWDSLKKGLLSAEKLQYDLRRLETAYLEQNRREFELTKHISLSMLDPLALVKLRETGRCFFHLPEEIFDLDYPGHYFRRIKSVSITLPCVVGPYTTISCTLRLLKNSIRINTTKGDYGYLRNTDEGLPTDDSRFVETNIPVKAIAASNAQNDSGVFELSFRDERYLPFEGAGVISEWSLELFNDLPSNNPIQGKPDFGKPLRQFDYSTISDAILHIKYTAREDAGAFKNLAVAHLRDYFQDGSMHSLRLFNLRQEFPTQWYRFLNPTNPEDGNVFELEMLTSLFPFRDEGKTLKVNMIWLFARCTDKGDYSVIMSPPLLPPPPVGSNTIKLAQLDEYGGLLFSKKPVTIEIVPTEPPIKWQLRMIGPCENLGVEEVLFVLGYEWKQSVEK